MTTVIVHKFNGSGKHVSKLMKGPQDSVDNDERGIYGQEGDI